MNVDQSTALVAVVAAGVPSVLVGGLGYFLRRTLEKLEGSVERVGASLAIHNTSLAVLEQRLAALETVRITRLEEEVGNLRQKLHDSAAQVQALILQRGAR